MSDSLGMSMRIEVNVILYALIIAGGRGERLQPFTNDRPKPMVEIDGKPIISYQVDWMRDQGVTDVVFLTGYMGGVIQDYFGTGSEHGIVAHYSNEESPLGRGGALKQGFSQVPLSVEYVLVTNGDVITNQPLEPLIDIHQESEATGTVMLVPYPNQYGVVESDEKGIVTKFAEKGELPYWINAGVYIFDRAIESLLPDVGDHEVSTFQDLAKQAKLLAYQSEMTWVSIDSPKDLSEVSEKMNDGFFELSH
jgi:NDP-sugar pyrophosphorylase family protein